MAEKKKESVFTTLNGINVNGHTEKKKTGSTELTYLSWSWAWAEVKKLYPDASYTVYKDENYHPYIEDPDFGLMCYTTVTIDGQTHEMWLPVMNGANKAMRRHPYTYSVWNSYKRTYEEKQVEAATMFDINKTIMRCLVKNLAMFGLGLYIYSGEDLPEDEIQVVEEKTTKKKTTAKASAAPQNDELQDAYEIIKPNIMTASRIDDLVMIYKDNQSLHDYKPFKDLLSNKKKELQNGTT